MFDDVAGFGAWHRRWVLLEANHISYWQYPEDEVKKEPLGRIDLAYATTELVTIAPREICSRMNTFMLETERQANRQDKDSLVVVRNGARTTLRHLITADSRPERLVWCDVINRALENLRAWDPVR